MTSRKEKPIIEVKNLSKQYQIGMDRTYKRFTESFTNAVRHPIRTLSGLTEPKDTFWALKDVNFEVERGEVLGIIGRNGAGKSTLLKILSRITHPTEGEIVMRGRVGSLLEVGTGFHPELTGRENIFFNGAILGMKKREIEEKFDEIVKFSGVEKFLDTPVKRYSSGMQVRLAFSVAAHLDPEILLVDEVLAVGDAEFQKKCLGKMGEVASEGRTVLFVSHNMAAVQQLCSSGILLDEGKIVFSGTKDEAVRNYLQCSESDSKGDIETRKDRQGSQWLTFSRVSLFNSDGNEISRILCGQDVYIRFYYQSKKQVLNASVLVAFNISNSLGYLLANLNSADSGPNQFNIYKDGYFECYLPKFNLRSDVYECTLFCAINGEIVDWVRGAFRINVDDGDYYGTGKLIEREQGIVLMDCSWDSKNEDHLTYEERKRVGVFEV
ncbi:ABC transporter ATP-binding protein [Methanoculleus chikugoensis]|uniref:ABC transporter ATP-binding protein n=1 Tax=Methanoculleus chikugoensis TaxID=118126 RepID=A0ABM7H770_9EURY|nr:ABC transporter ATP-binding protein [Methanoculleus chikugoensis]BBL68647.1 ABC transporter ATP-binding protein [Methanoculleus chikugoensis]